MLPQTFFGQLENWHNGFLKAHDTYTNPGSNNDTRRHVYFHKWYLLEKDIKTKAAGKNRYEELIWMQPRVKADSSLTEMFGKRFNNYVAQISSLSKIRIQARYNLISGKAQASLEKKVKKIKEIYETIKAEHLQRSAKAASAAAKAPSTSSTTTSSNSTSASSSSRQSAAKHNRSKRTHVDAFAKETKDDAALMPPPKRRHVMDAKEMDAKEPEDDTVAALATFNVLSEVASKVLVSGQTSGVASGSVTAAALGALAEYSRVEKFSVKVPKSQVMPGGT